MTYQPKFQPCPYRTGDGKCTHKTPITLKSKKKRLCGYGDPKDCQMYNEWEKKEKPILPPLECELELNKDWSEQ